MRFTILTLSRRPPRRTLSVVRRYKVFAP